MSNVETAEKKEAVEKACQEKPAPVVGAKAAVNVNPRAGQKEREKPRRDEPPNDEKRQPAAEAKPGQPQEQNEQTPRGSGEKNTPGPAARPQAVEKPEPAPKSTSASRPAPARKLPAAPKPKAVQSAVGEAARPTVGTRGERILDRLLHMADDYLERGNLFQAMEIYLELAEEYGGSEQGQAARDKVLDIADDYEREGKLHQARALYERLL